MSNQELSYISMEELDLRFKRLVTVSDVPPERLVSARYDVGVGLMDPGALDFAPLQVALLIEQLTTNDRFAQKAGVYNFREFFASWKEGAETTAASQSDLMSQLGRAQLSGLEETRELLNVVLPGILPE